MEDFYYEAYLDEYASKSTKAILGRKKAILNRIQKTYNWEVELAKGRFIDSQEAIRALDFLLEGREKANLA